MKSKLLFVVLVILVSSLAFTSPTAAMDDDMCSHDAMTIESLHHCVDHAVEMGHITNAHWATSLYAMLNAAQAALDRGQIDTAVNILNAFINEVNAYIRSGVLTQDEGLPLIDAAKDIIWQIRAGA